MSAVGGRPTVQEVAERLERRYPPATRRRPLPDLVQMFHFFKALGGVNWWFFPWNFFAKKDAGTDGPKKEIWRPCCFRGSELRG